MVAVMSYSGYDIEDAIVLNKASLDRGFGRCQVKRMHCHPHPNLHPNRPHFESSSLIPRQVLRKYATMMKRYPNGTVDRIVAPPADCSEPRNARFRALDKDGIAEVGAAVNPRDFLVAKQVQSPSPSPSPLPLPLSLPSPPPIAISIPIPTTTITQMPINTNDTVTRPDSLGEAEYVSSPLPYIGPNTAQVDQVLLTSNENDHFLIKVLMRSTRRPELGDKFSSRHGQKGVCGVLVNQEDMPFNELGKYHPHHNDLSLFCHLCTIPTHRFIIVVINAIAIFNDAIAYLVFIAIAIIV